MMLMTFKALSVLLSYPTPELKPALPEIARVIAEEKILSPSARGAVDGLIGEMFSDDLYDLQERYVLLFDRSRTLSFNLFEHVHGESRERGSAMLDLLETYRAGGFDLAGQELPDHLPVFLEFLATRPIDEAKALLADAGHILAALAQRLARRESSYAAPLAALSELAGIESGSLAVAELLQEADEDPEDLAALDAVWEEAEVTFGPDPNAGCSIAEDMVARMKQPRGAENRTSGAAATIG